MLQKEGLPIEKTPSKETRRIVLDRDNYQCVRCGKSIMRCRYSIHHRRLRSHPFPGLHKASNLITLCGSGDTGCHGWVHSHPSEAREHGWIVAATGTPATIAVYYAWRDTWLQLADNGATYI